MKTLLIPNVGRRCELVDRFRRTAKTLGIDLRIVATEVSDLAPALYKVDEYRLVGKDRNSALVSTYVELMRNWSVNYILPVIDPDLEFFASNRRQIERLANVELVSCSLELTRIANDKFATCVYFEKHGVAAPKCWATTAEIASAQFPVFAKPIDGSGSEGATTLKCIDDLESHLEVFSGRKFVFQEYVRGMEYTIDCFVRGTNILVSPRVRIKTRAGEVAVSQIHLRKDLIDESIKVLSQAGFYGPVTLQAILCEKTNSPKFIEINTRIGGGAILSIEAGLDIPRYILEDSEVIAYPVLKDGLLMIRYDESVFLDRGSNVN